MSVDVVTLGKEGILSDVNLKIDYLMCCYFFSKYSQTTLYRGLISSLTKEIQLYGNDDIDITRELTTSLTAYLQKYFTSVKVDISVEDHDPGINLQINAIVSDGDSIDSSPASVGYSLLTNDSKLRSIVNINTENVLYAA